MDKYLQKAALKAGKGYLRDQEVKRSNYQISAPDKDPSTHKKLKDRAKLAYEVEAYTAAGIPEADIKILMKVKRNARRLDAGHSIGPLKYGRASIIGLLPLVGDFADVMLAYWDVYLPASKVSKGKDMTAFKSGMKVRIVCLGSIGSIPVVGDFADTIIRWNMRNAAALEKMLLMRAGFFDAAKEAKMAAKSGRRVGTGARIQPALGSGRLEEYTPTQLSEESLPLPASHQQILDSPPGYSSRSTSPPHLPQRPAQTQTQPQSRSHTFHRVLDTSHTSNADEASHSQVHRSDRHHTSPANNSSASTGAKIGAAVGGFLGGLHGRAAAKKAARDEDEFVRGADVVPARPVRPVGGL